MTGSARARAEARRALAEKLAGKVSWPVEAELIDDEDGCCNWTFGTDEAAFVALTTPREVRALLAELDARTAALEDAREALLGAFKNSCSCWACKAGRDALARLDGVAPCDVGPDGRAHGF